MDLPLRTRTRLFALGPISGAPDCEDAAAVYRYPARRTLVRLFRPWCDEHGLTAFEALHRAEALTALAADERLISHALNRVATVQARAGGRPIEERRAVLDRLYAAVMGRAIQSEALAPWDRTLAEEGMAALARRVRDRFARDEFDHVVTHALAKRLEGTRGWAEKVAILAGLIEGAAGSADALGALDEALAETLDGLTPIRTVFGAAPDTATGIARLARAARGEWAEEETPGGVLPRLTALIAAHGLPTVRAVLMSRAARWLDGTGALSRPGAAGEAETLRALLPDLLEVGGFRGGAAVGLAATRRAQRAWATGPVPLPMDEAVARLLEALPDPATRVGYLLDLLAANPAPEDAEAMTRHLARTFAGIARLSDFFAGAPEAWADSAVRAAFRARLEAGGIGLDATALFMRRLEQVALAAAGPAPEPEEAEVRTVHCQIQALSLPATIQGPHLALYYQGHHCACGPDGEVTLGRAGDCDLVIAARTASRHHAAIRARQGDYRLTDRSRNGTLVRIGLNKPVLLHNATLTLTGTGTIHFSGDGDEEPVVFCRVRGAL